MFGAPFLDLRVLFRLRSRRHGNIDHHPPVALVVRRCISSDGNREREILIARRRRFGDSNAAPFLRGVAKGKLRLCCLTHRHRPAAPRPITLEPLAELSAPRLVLYFSRYALRRDAVILAAAYGTLFWSERRAIVFVRRGFRAEIGITKIAGSCA